MEANPTFTYRYLREAQWSVQKISLPPQKRLHGSWGLCPETREEPKGSCGSESGSCRLPSGAFMLAPHSGRASLVAQRCKAGAEGSSPGSGRSPGGGHGSPPQYSCLESPMDRGAWWATVHGVTESDMTWCLNRRHHSPRDTQRQDPFNVGTGLWQSICSCK